MSNAKSEMPTLRPPAVSIAACGDADIRGAAGDAHAHAGIGDRRQPVDRAQLDVAGDEIDRKPVFRNRRSAAGERMGRRVDGDFRPLQHAAVDALEHPFAHFRIDHHRPHALQVGRRHRRAGDARRQPRLGGRIVERAGAGDADGAVGDIALGQNDPLAFDVEAHADGDAVEDQRRFALGARQHDGAAGEAELPVRHAVVRRLEMRQQRDAVLSGDDLERRDQHAPGRIPVDADVGAVDVHRIFGRAAVDDAAGLDADLAGEIGRQSVASDLAAQAAGDRQVGGIGRILQAQREQDVLDREPARR